MVADRCIQSRSRIHCVPPRWDRDELTATLWEARPCYLGNTPTVFSGAPFCDRITGCNIGPK